jgi:Protein of unknown function (DUF3047)
LHEIIARVIIAMMSLDSNFLRARACSSFQRLLFVTSVVAVTASFVATAQSATDSSTAATPPNETTPVESRPDGAPKNAPSTTATPNAINIPAFSALPANGALTGWTFQPLRGVKKTTTYTAVLDADTKRVVIDGKAQGAAAALGVRLDYDVKQQRMLRFSWKVGSLLESSDPTTKGGDDYAARVYVTFAHDSTRSTFRERTENVIFRTLYGETPPRTALAYVFTHKAKTGDIIVSPFTSRVKKIVVDADTNAVAKWKNFERDVYADYKRAFNEEPTRISGIAIMVDTDNTGETASSRFGDISLSEK